jgi:plastocyanin
VRRTLVALTLVIALGTLAAACGSGGAAGGGAAGPATTAAPADTGSGGDMYGGGGYGRSQTTTAAAPAAAGTAVTINGFAFSPATLKVAVGQKVVWTNKQTGVTHTVTANGGAFDRTVPAGATFSFAFTKTGTFAYHCSIHQTMHGTVVVS